MQPKIILGPGGTPFIVLGDSTPHVDGKNGKADREPTVTLLPASAYTPEPVRWLWDGWLARGKLHLLAGAPGTGKTTIALSIAATVSVGVRWPDGTAGEHGDVLIWSGEDDIKDTLLPRLMVAGGNLDRVHFVNDTTEYHGKARPFDPATDMPALVKAARQLPNLKLIILDPVVAVLGSLDSHRNTETLRGGPMATREIRAAANANGHSWRTLNRAKDSMGVKAIKGGFESGWSWYPPPPPKNASDGSEECQQV
jgi:hypothetical protein